MSGAPLVSILLPVRNGFPWLPAALASLRAQTLEDYELLILEDGSTDETPAFLGSLRDARLRVIPTGGVGIARALNTGLEAATGTYIARQDADDESMPARLAAQVGCLDARPDISVVATVADYIDDDGRPIDDDWVATIRRQQDTALTPDAIAHLMPLTCCITHGSIMARTEVLRVAGGYRHEFVPADDYDLWLRLLPIHRFAKLAQPLYRYRVHRAQLGARMRVSQTTHAITAKLLYLRRQYPHLATPARLAALGSIRGDDCYRIAAPRAEFEYVPPSASWDVLAITDLSRVGEFERRLGLGPGRGVANLGPLENVGNLFVRVPASVREPVLA